MKFHFDSIQALKWAPTVNYKHYEVEWFWAKCYWSPPAQNPTRSSFLQAVDSPTRASVHSRWSRHFRSRLQLRRRDLRRRPRRGYSGAHNRLQLRWLSSFHFYFLFPRVQLRLLDFHMIMACTVLIVFVITCSEVIVLQIILQVSYSLVALFLVLQLNDLLFSAIFGLTCVHIVLLLGILLSFINDELWIHLCDDFLWSFPVNPMFC